jgi:hypothetical protein
MEKTNFNFGILGGMPLTQEILQAFQDNNTLALQAIAELCGNNCIISGLTAASGVISEGFVVLNNEVLYCAGGQSSLTSKLKVEETTETLIYQETGAQEVVTKRQAVINNDSGTALFSMRRLNGVLNNADVNNLIDQKLNIATCGTVDYTEAIVSVEVATTGSANTLVTAQILRPNLISNPNISIPGYANEPNYKLHYSFNGNQPYINFFITDENGNTVERENLTIVYKIETLV